MSKKYTALKDRKMKVNFEFANPQPQISSHGWWARWELCQEWWTSATAPSAPLAPPPVLLFDCGNHVSSIPGGCPVERIFWRDFESHEFRVQFSNTTTSRACGISHQVAVSKRKLESLEGPHLVNPYNRDSLTRFSNKTKRRDGITSAFCACFWDCPQELRGSVNKNHSSRISEQIWSGIWNTFESAIEISKHGLSSRPNLFHSNSRPKTDRIIWSFESDESWRNEKKSDGFSMSLFCNFRCLLSRFQILIQISLQATSQRR